MTFRTRLTVSMILAVALPLVGVFFGVRFELGQRLESRYRDRIEASLEMVQRNIESQSRGLHRRLDGLENVMRSDNDLRRAVEGDRRYAAYLRDYAARIMDVSGLAMLQVQAADGTILSSGHFRNQFGVGDERSRLIGSGLVVMDVKTAARRFVALAARDSVVVARRMLTIVGGIELDDGFFSRLSDSDEIAVSLHYPGGVVGPAVDPAATGYLESRVSIPFLTEAGSVESASIAVVHSSVGLSEIRALLDRWILLVGVLVVSASLVAAFWLSRQLSDPLRVLAAKTRDLDLDRLDITFGTGGTDEFGSLSRTLDDLVRRLRESLASLREAERHATTGELARQVNHDIKNGLAPLRNVLDHLKEVAKSDPDKLAGVFSEREHTLHDGVDYLERLAANYAGLRPRPIVTECDVNGVIGDIVRQRSPHGLAQVTSRLDPAVPTILFDATMLRRIVENLLDNAGHVVSGQPEGEVIISTSLDESDTGYVRISIEDNGPGMSEHELDAAFEDFYTTREGGSGLGLSIVRRLVLDADGRIRVQSEPGKGTVFHVDFPVNVN